jgi:hypothetical protein
MSRPRILGVNALLLMEVLSPSTLSTWRCQVQLRHPGRWANTAADAWQRWQEGLGETGVNGWRFFKFYFIPKEKLQSHFQLHRMGCWADGKGLTSKLNPFTTGFEGLNLQRPCC